MVSTSRARRSMRATYTWPTGATRRSCGKPHARVTPPTLVSCSHGRKRTCSTRAGRWAWCSSTVNRWGKCSRRSRATIKSFRVVPLMRWSSKATTPILSGRAWCPASCMTASCRISACRISLDCCAWRWGNPGCRAVSISRVIRRRIGSPMKRFCGRRYGSRRLGRRYISRRRT